MSDECDRNSTSDGNVSFVEGKIKPTRRRLTAPGQPSTKFLHSKWSRFLTDKSEKNVLIIGLSMFLVFCAFNTAQNFATSNHGNVGAISLGILYGVNTIGCLIIPNIINNYISPKYAMFWGSMTYAFYVGSNIQLIIVLLYIASAIEGIGAALLWVGEAVLITQCANEFETKYNLPLNSELGYFNGIFWFCFQFNQFIGNLTAAILFQYGVSKKIIYLILTIVNIIGTFLFLFIKPFKNILPMMNFIQPKNTFTQSPHSSLNTTQRSRIRTISSPQNSVNDNQQQQNKSNISNENGSQIQFDYTSNYKQFNDIASARINDNSYNIVIPVSNTNTNTPVKLSIVESPDKTNDDHNNITDIRLTDDYGMSETRDSLKTVVLKGKSDKSSGKFNRIKNNKNISDESKHRLLYEKYYDNIDGKKLKVDPLLVVKMWFDKHLWIILPITIYSGVTQGFQFGEFATLINGNANKFYALASFGFADAISSILFGKISDKVGRLPILFISMICHSFVYIYLFLFYSNGNIKIINNNHLNLNFIDKFEHGLFDTNLYIWLILGMFLGVGDAGFNTQIYSLYPILLGDCPEAFANFNFWQSVSTCWCFIWQGYVSLNVRLITYFGVLFISAIPLFGTKLGRVAASSKK